ncbi:MAG: PASTA domain-containing protein [Sphingobacteriales bacterium JAD_PAG50586_3]|nr:MAG: PASTA domain-containing protein [Sphingobacteriales bacterium JAD_PAG50586_3]
MNFISFVRTKTFWQHVFLATSSVVLFSWLALWGLKMYTSPGDKIKVPDFRGLKIEDVSSFASKEGVDYMIIDSIFDPKGQKGIVIGQDPMPNATAKEGRTIYLTVTSTRPQLVKMPNLLDQSLKSAAATLETYGLKMGRIRYIEGLPVVLRMAYDGKDIKAGTMLEKGSVIEVYVGKGIISDGIVPNLVGLTRDEAINILSSKGFMLGVVQYDGTFATGTDSSSAFVYRQSPLANDSTKIKTGAFIDIFLRKEVLEQSAPDSSTITNEQQQRPDFEK